MVDGFSDGFSARYGDLLYGSYDCVDRIVLNAYYPLGYNPGGWTSVDRDYEKIRIDLQTVFQHLGIQAAA